MIPPLHTLLHRPCSTLSRCWANWVCPVWLCEPPKTMSQSKLLSFISSSSWAFGCRSGKLTQRLLEPGLPCDHSSTLPSWGHLVLLTSMKAWCHEGIMSQPWTYSGQWPSSPCESLIFFLPFFCSLRNREKKADSYCWWKYSFIWIHQKIHHFLSIQRG